MRQKLLLYYRCFSIAISHRRSFQQFHSDMVMRWYGYLHIPGSRSSGHRKSVAVLITNRTHGVVLSPTKILSQNLS